MAMKVYLMGDKEMVFNTATKFAGHTVAGADYVVFVDDAGKEVVRFRVDQVLGWQMGEERP